MKKVRLNDIEVGATFYTNNDPTSKAYEVTDRHPLFGTQISWHEPDSKTAHARSSWNKSNPFRYVAITRSDFNCTHTGPRHNNGEDPITCLNCGINV